MSRLNFNLKNIPEALNHIEAVLMKKKIPQKVSSYQSDTKQYPTLIDFTNETNIIKDFILYSNTLIQELKQPLTSLPLISVPLVESNNLKLNLYPSDVFKLRHGSVLVHNDNNMDYLKEPLSHKEKELISSLNNTPNMSLNVNDTKQLNELKEMWFKFEQALYISAYRTALPILFKQYLTILDQTTDNKQMPKAVLDETLKN